MCGHTSAVPVKQAQRLTRDTINDLHISRDEARAMFRRFVKREIAALRARRNAPPKPIRFDRSHWINPRQIGAETARAPA